jgi:hypothetical protein
LQLFHEYTRDSLLLKRAETRSQNGRVPFFSL